MSKIKVCGIRRIEDIEYVNNSRPDYVGFVFAESKRRVSVETVITLGSKLGRGIKKVGIFVNEAAESVMDTAKRCSLDVVQLHGSETPEYVENLQRMIKKDLKLNVEVWKAIRVKDIRSIEQMECFKADAFVLDAFSEGIYGGTGKAFDWGIAIEAKKHGKVFLAGGLNLQNVQEAVKAVKPYGVDVSSGVETDGFKDRQKVREFILKVREWDGR